MVGVSKIYPGGVLANDTVSFDVRKGEIHALLGENGAGKTTLMKILAGCLAPTRGEIIVDNVKVRFRSPADAINSRIGMVHQHFTLVPSLTVAENILLGMRTRRAPLLALREVAREIEDLSGKVGLKVDPNAPVYALSVGERQRVEILRLLYRQAQILIFDEPTSILCGPEVDALFKVLRNLKSLGCSIILVTHKIREALEVSERLTVLRKSLKVATLLREDADERKLVGLMIGETVPTAEVTAEIIAAQGIPREPRLTVKDITVKDDRGRIAIKNVSFEVFSGEILGLAGVEGNGQKELVESIVGMRRPVSGNIMVGRMDLTGKSPSDYVAGRNAYVPADRITRGIAPDLEITINANMKTLDERSFRKRWVLDWDRLRGFASQVVNLLGVITPSLSTPTKFLSGGNIQKLIVGRETVRTPRFLIVEQPTAGLDVKTGEKAHSVLRDLRSSGTGILLVSADLDEILKLSDRVAVIFEGRIVGLFNREEASYETIGASMLRGESRRRFEIEA